MTTEQRNGLAAGPTEPARYDRNGQRLWKHPQTHWAPHQEDPEPAPAPPPPEVIIVIPARIAQDMETQAKRTDNARDTGAITQALTDIVSETSEATRNVARRLEPSQASMILL